MTRRELVNLCCFAGILVCFIVAAILSTIRDGFNLIPFY